MQDVLLASIDVTHYFTQTYYTKGVGLFYITHYLLSALSELQTAKCGLSQWHGRTARSTSCQQMAGLLQEIGSQLSQKASREYS